MSLGRHIHCHEFLLVSGSFR